MTEFLVFPQPARGQSRGKFQPPLMSSLLLFCCPKSRRGLHNVAQRANAGCRSAIASQPRRGGTSGAPCVSPHGAGTSALAHTHPDRVGVGYVLSSLTGLGNRIRANLRSVGHASKVIPCRFKVGRITWRFPPAQNSAPTKSPARLARAEWARCTRRTKPSSAAVDTWRVRTQLEVAPAALIGSATRSYKFRLKL